MIMKHNKDKQRKPVSKNNNEKHLSPYKQEMLSQQRGKSEEESSETK